MLAHARLKIQDLSDNANQPMLSASGRYRLIFNGEIYNFVEIRKKLQNHFQFRTESDTEVLLCAWEKWGEGSLEFIKGIFHFVFMTRTLAK